MYIDSHAHLEGAKFAADRGEALFRAQQAGVEAMVAIGNGDGPQDFDCGVKLAEGHPRIWATVGIHPHEARLADDAAYARMEEIARHPKLIAIGEIGLDYHYDHSPREVQREVLARQIAVAKHSGKPVVIHNRPSDNSDNAWVDLFALLKEHWSGGGVMHCFTGTVEHMQRALDMGFLISFAGNVSYPKALQIREAAKACPLDRMLIETDSPYLAPVPHRGKRNEPAFVVETAKAIGALRGVSGEAIGQATTENFYRFFRLR